MDYNSSQQFFIQNFEAYSYLAIFLASFFAGYLVPFPEEVLFVLIGYVSALGFSNIYLAVIFSVLGIILGDNVVFWIGHKGSWMIDKFKKRMREDQIRKYDELMHDHAGKTIFTSRFIPTIRVFVPLLAGSMRIKWKKFIFYDFLAVLANIPIIILLGYAYESKISVLISRVETTRHIIGIFSLIIIGTLLSFFIRILFFNRK